MAWVSASIPVSAAILGGMPAVRALSKMAMSGLMHKLMIGTFKQFARSEITEVLVASDPVPEVEGIAISVVFSLLDGRACCVMFSNFRCGNS
ncbi:hypothetical protein SDC9_191400 [bioreactor metagenome]|uniref:Uncharacterized protein n=1 Tax=bioreactor metagenome TaxID=1076179 RepID=A0A645I072_9ZZZZ